MNFADDYNVNSAELIHPAGRDFTMYVTPGYRARYEGGPYESFTADLLNRILTRNKLFIEVGAHYGFFSLLAASNHPALEIIALEPTPESCSVLRRNVEHLGASNVSARPIAVSDSTGNATYTIAAESGHCGFYKHPHLPPLRTIEVETVSIDALLKDREPCPTIIKISAEGHEITVLNGMVKTLKNFSDIALIIEFNPQIQRAAGHGPEALLKELERLGFEMFLLDDQKRLSYRLRPESDWSQFMDPLGYANLYCMPKDRALSVCFFSHTANLEGAERSLLELVDEFISDHGAVCTVALPGNGPLVAKLEQAGAACIITNPHYSWWCCSPEDGITDREKEQTVIDSIRTVMGDVLPVLIRVDPDVIWTQTLVIPWGAMIAGLMSKPHVWSVHEFGERDHGLKFFYPFEQILRDIETSSAIIKTNSDAVTTALFPTVPPRRLLRLYNYVPVPHKYLSESDRTYFQVPGAIKLVNFGNINPSKGQADVVSATAELLASGRNVELLLAGKEDIEYRRKLEVLISNRSIEDNVRFVGFLDNPYPAMQDADIVIICSRSEAFGRIAVEAMLLGKPVVYPNAGGYVEYMVDGQTGLSYPPGDINALVERIERLLDNPDLRVKLGEFACSYASAKFTRDAYGGEAFRALLKLRSDDSKAAQVPGTIRRAMCMSIAASHQENIRLRAESSRQGIQLNECNNENARLRNDLSTITNTKLWRLAELVRKPIERLYEAKAFIRNPRIAEKKSGNINMVFNPDSIGNTIFRDQQNEIPREEFQDRIADFQLLPKIAIIMPVYNTNPKYLELAISSVLRQVYDNWELCIVDNASTRKRIRRILEKYSKLDGRIKIEYLSKNSGISAASNKAIEISKGEFLALLDHDDEITPDALFWVVNEINKNPDADLIYTDECKKEADGTLTDFFFKPDWSPELLLNDMYTSHLSVYRRSMVENVGKFRTRYDFAQDYDLALRVTERTNRIRHIERILYCLRGTGGSAVAGGKRSARGALVSSLEDAMKRRNIDCRVHAYPHRNRVEIASPKKKKVSIIIPSDSYHNVKNALDEILNQTDYPDYEVLVVTNSNLINEFSRQYAQHPRVRFSAYDKSFNFSDKCNQGARDSKGDILIFFNDDVRPTEKEWIGNIIAYLYIDGVGGVSPKLVFEDNTIQYAGMICNVRNLTGTFLINQPNTTASFFHFAQRVRNVSILSGACLAIKKEVFTEIGGFDSVHVPQGHSDVDFSFRLRERGYRCVYTPDATLVHIGNRSWSDTGGHHLFCLYRWGSYLSNDPYYTKSMRYAIEGYGPDSSGIYAGNQEYSEPKLRALLISHELSNSGAPRVLVWAANSIKKAGGYSVVIAPKDGPVRGEFEKLGIPVIVNDLIFSKPDTMRFFVRNFDVAVANTAVSVPFVDAFSTEIPILWWIHEAAVIDKVCRIYDYTSDVLSKHMNIYVPSRYCKDYITRFNRNVELLPYGMVDRSKDSKHPTKRNSRVTFSVIGSVYPGKAQDIFIDAILALPDSYRAKACFNIIGGFADRDFSKELFDKTRDIKEIRFWGETPYEKTIELLTQTDVVVMVSRDDSLPLAVMEALMFAKPCIVSDRTGYRDYIKHGINGFIINNEDYRGLCSIMMDIIKNPEILKPIQEEARKLYLDGFTEEKFNSRFVAALFETMTDYSRG